MAGSPQRPLKPPAGRPTLHLCPGPFRGGAARDGPDGSPVVRSPLRTGWSAVCPPLRGWGAQARSPSWQLGREHTISTDRPDKGDLYLQLSRGGSRGCHRASSLWGDGEARAQGDPRGPTEGKSGGQLLLRPHGSCVFDGSPPSESTCHGQKARLEREAGPRCPRGKAPPEGVGICFQSPTSPPPPLPAVPGPAGCSGRTLDCGLSTTAVMSPSPGGWPPEVQALGESASGETVGAPRLLTDTHLLPCPPGVASQGLGGSPVDGVGPSPPLCLPH